MGTTRIQNTQCILEGVYNPYTVEFEGYVQSVDINIQCFHMMCTIGNGIYSVFGGCVHSVHGVFGGLRTYYTKCTQHILEST